MFKFLKLKWELVLLVIFIIIAGILRFYHINRLEFFTYDQARDALFVKRMIVDHQWRLLGTQTSLPGMYLPPFYYYTIAPVLWLFKLNPVGIDIYSALIGVLTVPLVFLVANKIFGRPTGVFSAGLFAVSPIVVELTRRSWNCNTMPFFILLSFYFVYLYFKEKKLKYYLLSFLVYGYCLSLHFGAWTLLPLFGAIWIYSFTKKGEIGFKKSLLGLVILFFFVSPLLIFELRHNFFLVSQAKTFFFDGGHIGVKAGVNFFESFISSLIALFTILISGRIEVGYGAPLEFSGKLKEFFVATKQISVVAQKPFSLTYQGWGVIIFLIILSYCLFLFFKVLKNKELKDKNHQLPLLLIWIWVLWGIFASRIYSGSFFFFYYLYIFPVPVLLFGFLFKKGFEVKKIRMLVLGIFFLIIFFHVRFTTVFQQGWRDINDLRQVSEVIAKNTEVDKSFNIATIQKETDRWDRNAVDYRFFVEAFGKKRALDWLPQDYQNAQILFVVDETGQSNPLSSPIMEIQEFKPGKIINQWEVAKGIKIYKLAK